MPGCKIETLDPGATIRLLGISSISHRNSVSALLQRQMTNHPGKRERFERSFGFFLVLSKNWGFSFV